MCSARNLSCPGISALVAAQNCPLRCMRVPSRTDILLASARAGMRRSMKRRELISLLGGAVVAWPFAVFAQVPARRPLVAVLVAGSSTNVSRRALNGFSEGMQALGYVE